ncbi:MAG: RNA polymerase sigma factor [Ktedonobacteraceae bacterium]
MISDENLIDAVAKGDVAAMETLYERYSRPFFSLAYRMTTSRHISEDLVQAAFLVIWQHRTSYSREVGSVHSWLFSIMHYRVIDYLRHRRCNSMWKEISWEEVAYEEHSLLSDPWEDIWHMEQTTLIRKAMQNIPEKQRSVIELAYFEGLTHEEIAQHCHIPLGTAKSRLRLGLLHLKRELIEQGLVGV